MTTPIQITTQTITLGQFLKLADVVEHGGAAKQLLADQRVTVNDVVEARRGRKLGPGDRVAVDGQAFLVVGSDAPG